MALKRDASVIDPRKVPGDDRSKGHSVDQAYCLATGRSIGLLNCTRGLRLRCCFFDGSVSSLAKACAAGAAVGFSSTAGSLVSSRPGSRLIATAPVSGAIPESGAEIFRLVRSKSKSRRGAAFGTYASSANMRQSRAPPTHRRYCFIGMTVEHSLPRPFELMDYCPQDERVCALTPEQWGEVRAGRLPRPSDLDLK
jgi:hypothetical protein